jgi:DnaJ-class molecular chaperone
MTDVFTAPKAPQAMTHIKAKCARCSGAGTVPHRTARDQNTCFCCGGRGFIMRRAPGQRMTHAEKMAQFNQRVATGLNPITGEPLAPARTLSE